MKDEITKILDLIENEKDKHWNRQEELLNNLGYGGSAQDQVHDAELEMDAYCVLNDLQCRIESEVYKNNHYYINVECNSYEVRKNHQVIAIFPKDKDVVGCKEAYTNAERLLNQLKGFD